MKRALCILILAPLVLVFLPFALVLGVMREPWR